MRRAPSDNAFRKGILRSLSDRALTPMPIVIRMMRVPISLTGSLTPGRYESKKLTLVLTDWGRK